MIYLCLGQDLHEFTSTTSVFIDLSTIVIKSSNDINITYVIYFVFNLFLLKLFAQIKYYIYANSKTYISSSSLHNFASYLVVK